LPVAKTKTLERILSVLKLIPVHPKWVTSRQIHQHLESANIKVTRRTIERDLLELSGIFGLTFGDSPEGYKWSFAYDSPHQFIPAISADEALSLTLVQKHLKQFMPPTSLLQLTALFKKAEQTLNKHLSLSNWPALVSSVPQAMNFKPINTNPEVTKSVYEALLEKRWLTITYKQKDKVFTILPLGVIVRDAKLVVVCQFKGFDDYRNLLLHRINSAQIQAHADTTVSPIAFDLDLYVKKQAVGLLLSDKNIALFLKVRGHVRQLLEENQLNSSQTISVIDDEWLSVEITLPHNLELENWLQSQLEHIQIVSPAYVKENIVQKVRLGLELNT